jgi:hypothetical protein
MRPTAWSPSRPGSTGGGSSNGSSFDRDAAWSFATAQRRHDRIALAMLSSTSCPHSASRMPFDLPRSAATPATRPLGRSVRHQRQPDIVRRVPLGEYKELAQGVENWARPPTPARRWPGGGVVFIGGRRTARSARSVRRRARNSGPPVGFDVGGAAVASGAQTANSKYWPGPQLVPTAAWIGDRGSGRDDERFSALSAGALAATAMTATRRGRRVAAPGRAGAAGRRTRRCEPRRSGGRDVAQGQICRPAKASPAAIPSTVDPGSSARHRAARRTRIAPRWACPTGRSWAMLTDPAQVSANGCSTFYWISNTGIGVAGSHRTTATSCSTR